MLKSISKGLVLEIAGGERWFSAIYVEDLVDGLLAAARTPARRGPRLFPDARQSLHPGASWRGSAAAIMRRRPRVLRVPLALAYGVGYCAESGRG